MRKKHIVIFMILSVLAFAGSSSAEVLFQDNFDSYAALGDDLHLQDVSSDWFVSATQPEWVNVRVGSWWGGRAYYSNGYWGEAALHMVQTDPGVSRYTVKVEAWEHAGTVSKWYAGARVTDTTYIAVGAVLGGADTEGNIPVYARVRDSADTATAGDWYVGTFDSTVAIDLEITVDGDQVAASVSHAGFSKDFSFTTGVLNDGNAGFSGFNEWGYAGGDFDNFEISSPSCGDPGVAYNIGDLNEDCVVDFYDFSILVSQWLECTDPEDPSCIQY